MSKFENLMMENHGVSIFVGWRMSIATKRPKERENQTPDELVMAKTVFGVGLKLGGAGTRGWEAAGARGGQGVGWKSGPGVRVPGDKRCGCPGVRGAGARG